MANLTGTFIGHAVIQNRIVLDDIPEHEMFLTHLTGELNVAEGAWRGARMTLWGTRDLVQGFGPIRGYFRNQHPNGDCDCGTYDGHLAVLNGEVTLEGSWRYTHGSGAFASISGNGRFRGRILPAAELEMSWQGSYQLAAGTRVA